MYIKYNILLPRENSPNKIKYWTKDILKLIAQCNLFLFCSRIEINYKYKTLSIQLRSKQLRLQLHHPDGATLRRRLAPFGLHLHSYSFFLLFPLAVNLEARFHNYRFTDFP